MEQQTAVEWLVNQEISVDLGSGIKMKIPIPQNVIDKAKQMEKEQMIDAFMTGEAHDICISAGQYYNQTYGIK